MFEHTPESTQRSAARVDHTAIQYNTAKLTALGELLLACKRLSELRPQRIHRVGEIASQIILQSRRIAS